MYSACLFRLHRNSILSHLKPVNGLFISTKPIPTPLVPQSSMLKCVFPVQNQSRTFWETFPSFGTSYHFKDGVKKENHDLIYRSRLFNYAFYSQLVSLTAFTVQLFYSSYQAYRSFMLDELMERTIQIGPFTATYDLVTLTILTLFTCQNILLYSIAQRAVLRIYHQKNTDKYVFVSLSINPFKSRLTFCEPGELKDLHIENVTSIAGNYALRGKKLFIKLENFKNAWHFNKLTGAPVI